MERIKGVFVAGLQERFGKQVPVLSNLVGLISDTHGLIRPEALDALRDSDLIIHCGDVGNLAVLDTLRRIAPVRAVRGNNDIGAWARGLPLSDVVEIGSHKIYILHNLSEFDVDPHTAIARAHRWFEELISARAMSLAAIASREGVTDR
jgi:Calcineurin-like phosphoesterase superfamily domain